MSKPFAIAVAAILLLTAVAILIVRRVTEPPPPGPAAGSAAASSEAPPQVLSPPSQADLPASGPAASNTPYGTNPYGAALNQPQPPPPAPGPAAQPAKPVDSEEGDQRRRPPGRVLNRGSRGDRPQQPNQSDE
jgi:hypothetical protein